jgi:hypothetical protein
LIYSSAALIAVGIIAAAGGSGSQISATFTGVTSRRGLTAIFRTLRTRRAGTLSSSSAKGVDAAGSSLVPADSWLNRCAGEVSGCTTIAAKSLIATNEHQDALSTCFARGPGDKWEGLKSVAGQTGVPLIPDALASFECENCARNDGGDHFESRRQSPRDDDNNCCQPSSTHFLGHSRERVRVPQAPLPRLPSRHPKPSPDFEHACTRWKPCYDAAFLSVNAGIHPHYFVEDAIFLP